MTKFPCCLSMAGQLKGFELKRSGTTVKLTGSIPLWPTDMLARAMVLTNSDEQNPACG